MLWRKNTIKFSTWERVWSVSVIFKLLEFQVAASDIPCVCYLDGSGGHLPGLVEVKRHDVWEAAGVGVHRRGAVAKSLQDGVDRLPLLSCDTTIIIKTSTNRWSSWHYCLFFFFCLCRLTREDFSCAPSDGDQILDQVLAVGGLATAGLSQQHNGLILAGGEQVAVRRLSHSVDVRSRVLTPAAFKHVHHLMVGGRTACYEGPKPKTDENTELFSWNWKCWKVLIFAILTES